MFVAGSDTSGHLFFFDDKRNEAKVRHVFPAAAADPRQFVPQLLRPDVRGAAGGSGRRQRLSGVVSGGPGRRWPDVGSAGRLREQRGGRQRDGDGVDQRRLGPAAAPSAADGDGDGGQHHRRRQQLVLRVGRIGGVAAPSRAQLPLHSGTFISFTCLICIIFATLLFIRVTFSFVNGIILIYYIIH